MRKGTRHVKAWAIVLTVFCLASLGAVAWKWSLSASVTSPQVQFVENSEPNLTQVRTGVVSLWAVRTAEGGSQIGMIGSGAIVDSRGYVLTTAALTPDIDTLYVMDADGEKYTATVVTADGSTPLTLLKADPGETAGSESFEAVDLSSLF